MEKDTKAAVVFLSGQSNATAHKQFLPEKDRVYEPMKNVFSLDRNPNQSFDIDDVVWSGWKSGGKNLGESQDHTASFAYFLAKKWQTAIDAGAELPDLYIVHISIGSQGIINGMWNRDKEKVLTPGTGADIDISLLPLALHIQSLAMKNLCNAGKNPEVIGWHWIGSESEIGKEAYYRDDFRERYDYHFDVMRKSMGGDVPTYIYRICVLRDCEKYGIPTEAEEKVNAELERQAERIGATLVDPRNSPFWRDDEFLFGVLYEDNAHYLPCVQEWFADEFLNKVIKPQL